MSALTIVRESPVVRTPRVQQCEGIFDLPPSERSSQTWTIDLDVGDEYQIGCLVGPSGSGKTVVAQALFGPALVRSYDWPREHSILDGFPATLGIKDIVALLSSVGFSSPPSWLRPYHVLSVGEQFRVTMARALAEKPDLAVMDEFTSNLDRTVARIGAAAMAKTVRARGQKFVACSPHYDIIDWLEPDWVYQPHTNELHRGRLWRRPSIELTLRRVGASAWDLFRHHHYLDTSLLANATCFVAFWEGAPVAFSAWIRMPHRGVLRGRREHRTVCLPDYQGVGIGNAVSNACAALWTALGETAYSTTSHPAMIRSRAHSPLWVMHRPPSRTYSRGTGRWRQESIHHLRDRVASKRLTAGFRYVGPPMDREQARALLAS